MIYLSRLDGTSFVLSADRVELIEAKPDTVITTVSGKHYVVKESVAEVVSRIIDYQRAVRETRTGHSLGASGSLGMGTQFDG